MSSRTEKYTLKYNNDETVDIILPKQKKLTPRAFRLFNYQLDFLVENYKSKDISTSLRMALNDLIKKENNFDNIILIQEEFE